MKKVLLVFGILMSFAHSSYAVLVTLPNKQTLTQRLASIGLDHFIEKTKIVSQLAGQEKEALGVAIAVECALYDYNEYLTQSMPDKQSRMMATLMNMRKPQIIEAILQDSPDALAELKQHKLI